MGSQGNEEHLLGGGEDRDRTESRFTPVCCRTDKAQWSEMTRGTFVVQTELVTCSKGKKGEPSG